MKPRSRESQPTLDETLLAVRDDEPAESAVETAAARAWDRIAQQLAPDAGLGPIRGCADVQALLPQLRQGTLAEARGLLVRDHLAECAACRARSEQPDAPRLAVLPWRPRTLDARATGAHWRRWAAAAALVLSLGAAEGVRRTFLAVPPGSRAAVQSTRGLLQRLTPARAFTLGPGETVGEAEVVRTANASHAILRLRDGDIVEMGERAELSVTARGQDTTIHLQRGNVIVQAVKRRAGRLLVVSQDCTVRVTGTVFSVRSGLRGSRVSVIEGTVKVVKGREERSLHPGEQWATTEAMGRVPLREEIAWSSQLDRHLALLGELQALKQQLNAVQQPGLRYQSRLLQRLPAGTLVFASFPNYGETLAEAHQIFERRLAESPTLRDWWQKAGEPKRGGPSLASVVERIRSLSQFLGDEIVFAVVPSGSRHANPVLLAEVRNPGLKEFLEHERSELQRDDARGPAFRIVEPTALSSTPTPHGVLVLLRDDLVAVSGSLPALGAIGAAPLHGGIEGSPFGQRIGQAYRAGVGLLFAADLEAITGASLAHVDSGGREAAALHEAGLDSLRHLVIESSGIEAGARSRATISFAGKRRGIASWLAAPGPMGSLDFVSPNAQLVAAFVSKSPATVLDDVLDVVNAGQGGRRNPLSEVESRLDLRLRDDFAATLGGEFGLALDGPALPVPSWKAVVEVLDPVRLQASIETLVARANDEASRQGRPPLRIEAEDVGGRTYHSLRGAGLPLELHYAFADGYLVAGPSRALVSQAIRTRESGVSLAQAPGFQALWPADGQSYASGLAYQNLAGSLGALFETASGLLDPDQRRALEALVRESKPTMAVVYGNEDSIEVASQGGLLELNPADLSLPLLLERLRAGTRAGRNP